MHEAAADRRTPDGFRERGAQVTRLEAFVDAAFAFALTLLVISIDAIPRSLDELVEALKGAPAFAASFAQIALVWFAHVRWSRRYGLEDTRSTLLSLLLVFLVLVFVYPLKMMFGLFFSWLSGGWIPWPARIESFRDIATLFAVYGAMFASLSWCLARLFANALRRRAEIGLDLDEAARTAGDVASWHFAAGVGLLSMTVALSMPADTPYWAGGLPGFVYVLMNLTFLVDRWATGRARRRLAEDEAP